MEKDTIEIKNESNDHNYFTVIPNYILNHSTATAQALYLQLKRLAGDNGVAYPGSRFLKERLHISQPTLRKEFKYLLDKGWIKFAGEKVIETDGGYQEVKAYKIVDLWQLNSEYYQKQRGEKIEPPCQRGEKIDTQGVKSGGEKIGTKEEQYNKIKSFNKSGDKSPTPKQEAKLFFENQEKQNEVISSLEEKFGQNQLIAAEVKKFVSYWTEPNSTGTKQRWEKQPTFEVSRRLATWFNNIKQFQGVKKIEKPIVL